MDVRSHETVIKGELFALKGCVHQLGGNTQRRRTAVDDFKGGPALAPRESDSVCFNVMLAQKIIILWANICN